MKYFTILFIAILILFNSCAATFRHGGTPPAWMTNLEADFPQSRYLAAVGSGSSRRRAQEDASALLAQQFSVHVRVNTVAQERYAELIRGDQRYREIMTMLNHTIGTQADQTFINLKFSDPYIDRTGTTHVVAYLERQPTALIYRDLIRRDLEKAEDYFRRANTAVGSLRRYAFFDAAYIMALNAERMIDQLRIIFPPMAAMMEMELDLRKFTAARDREAANLSYRIAIDGDTDGRIAGIVREAMSGQAISYSPNGSMVFRGTWSVTPVTVNPNFRSVNWIANISLFDEADTTIATFFRDARENGLTETQAETVAFREFQRQLSAELARGINAYLTGIVIGN
ncbi:MAG: LPP20 family lipoprotein [Spirochaetes bacterium]|nr:LPP20 family lipoprotein [Spirochaetota bacterium]